MKPTLVLGLALAANAMVADSADNNELFVAPTGKLAEWAKQHPHVMFDEQADDEFAVKYVHLPHIPAPEVVALDDDEFAYVPVVLAKYDEIADDELAINQRIIPAEHAAFDDDELVYARQPRDEAKVYEDYRRVRQLINRPQFPGDHDEFSHPIHNQQKIRIRPENVPVKTARFDEVADDELAINQRIVPAEHIAFDDDELVVYARQPRDEAKVAEAYYKALNAVNRPKVPQYPGENIPVKTARFDEVADDEFGVTDRPKLPRSRFNSDEEYEKYLTNRRNRRHYDDAADDELALKIVNFPAQHVAYDDDELLIRKPRRDEEYMKIADDELSYVPIVLAKYDEVADDEFAINQRIVHHHETQAFDDDELAIAPEQYQRLQNIRNPIYSRFDEVADDEFAINQQIIQQNLAFDDDELMRGIPPVENFKSYEEWLKFTRKMSDEADNELGVKYVHAPIEHIAYDDADDEFSYVPIVLAKYDEVADDELAYLGHLLNERAQPRSFDEYKKAEKPSSGKTKERNQPKRKLRPVVDEAPLAQH